MAGTSWKVIKITSYAISKYVKPWGGDLIVFLQRLFVPVITSV
jgi:hypothetical protein